MGLKTKLMSSDVGVQVLLTDYGDASGVMVIVVGNGHSDTSSNPGRD